MVEVTHSRECPWLSLLETVEQTIGHALAPAVREAFVRVDRRVFVPHYYVQQERRWVETRAREEVYENRAFFTRLDARGVPNSSSSQPSLMAPMLEALDVRLGMRVLEIGTGTGYNAALLAELVGEQGCVVSVDIAADLVEASAARLGVWSWVKAVTADGLLGYEPCAPYDRIIATGGAPTIPQAWVEQLATDGLLLGSLALKLSTPTPLYRVQKDQQGKLSGTFLATPAFFMALYQQELAPPTPNFAYYDALPVREQAWTQLPLPRLLKDPGLALWVTQRVADLRGALHPVGAASQSVTPCLWVPGQALLTVQPGAAPTQGFAIEVRGRAPIWSWWLAAYTEWDAQGRPAPEQYRLSVDHEAHLTIRVREGESLE